MTVNLYTAPTFGANYRRFGQNQAAGQPQQTLHFGEDSQPGLSRRGLLGLLGIGAGAAVAGVPLTAGVANAAGGSGAAGGNAGAGNPPSGGPSFRNPGPNRHPFDDHNDSSTRGVDHDPTGDRIKEIQNKRRRPGRRHNNGAAAAILKNPAAFAPTDPTMFTPDVYLVDKDGQTSPPLIYNATQRNYDKVKSELKDVLGRNGAVDQGMSFFKNPKAQQVIKDDTLRAAVAALAGTYGEQALSAVLAGEVKSVTYANPSETYLAATFANTPNEKVTVYVNPNIRGEDLRDLAPIMAHEILAHLTPVWALDPAAGRLNEEMGYVLQSIVSSQFAIKDPAVPDNISGLSRRMNTIDMALVNTRDELGHVNLTTSKSGNVYPGGTSLSSFGEVFGVTNTSAPLKSNEYLNKALAKITRTQLAKDNPFIDNALHRRVDQNIHNAFTDRKWVDLAEALRLNTNA